MHANAMEPTCVDTIVHTVADAHSIMFAVHQGIRPLVHRRPCNDDERACIRPGAVFVWEEGVSFSSKILFPPFQPPLRLLTSILLPPRPRQSGIERWTDRYRWGDSRSREVRAAFVMTTSAD
jgi:hypothetical protein